MSKLLLPGSAALLATLAFVGMALTHEPEALGQVKAETPKEKTLYETLNEKHGPELYNSKSDEIVKANLSETYQKDGYNITIDHVEKIDGGVAVFTRASKDGKPVGFTDGTVETERFKIYNPPLLVPDPNGPIDLTATNTAGLAIVRKYRLDPAEAVRQVIAQNVKETGKEDSKTIKAGSIGNTTSTFYPNADGDVGSTSADGWVRMETSSNWDTTRDATSAQAGEGGDDLFVDAGKTSGGNFRIRRGFFMFDTSAIPDTDTVSAVTASVYVNATNNSDNDGNDFMSWMSTSTPASNTNIVGDDYDQCGATEAHETSERKDITTIAAGLNQYFNWAFNATGIASVNKAGITKLCTREGHDLLDDPYSSANNTRNYVNGPYAEGAVGTTQDPKLVVVHAAPAAPVESTTVTWFD